VCVCVYYPLKNSASSPCFSICASFLSSAQSAAATAQLRSISHAHTGSVCIYVLALWLQTEAPVMFDWMPPSLHTQPNSSGSKRPIHGSFSSLPIASISSCSGSARTAARLRIVSGPIVTFKKSKFQVLHICWRTHRVAVHD
jgi:hypothetical protein